MSLDPNPDQTYRIGAVARLTGISVDRLRAWERRYAVVETRRTESLGRIYTRGDVDRLTMIKQLVDLGNPISSVAHLDDTQLADRLNQDNRSRAQLGKASAAPVRVAILGATLAHTIEGADEPLTGLDVLGVFHSFADFQRAASTLAPTVLIIEYLGVYDETVDEVRDLLKRSGAERAVLVCGFGRRETFTALTELGAVILRSPVSIEELEIACRFDVGPVEGMSENVSLKTDLGDVIPPRRFRDEDLHRLGGMSRSVECECPEHLITLIRSLAAFESYSANCRNRNPTDAALHAYLHRASAHARAIVEEALENVAEVEGLTR